jgi:plastocyanin
VTARFGTTTLWRGAGAALLFLAFELVAGGAPGARPVHAGGGGCHEPSPTDGTGTSVEIAGGCFLPTVLRVAEGEAVSFTNSDPYQHEVRGFQWGSEGLLNQGAMTTATFTSPGVYAYACTLHPGMVGAVVVGDGAAPEGAVAAVLARTGVEEPAAPEPGPPAIIVNGEGGEGLAAPIWALIGAGLGVVVAGGLAYVFGRRTGRLA